MLNIGRFEKSGFHNCSLSEYCILVHCRLFLRRGELDNPHKPKTWKTYKENFAVDITFTKL